MINTEVMSKVFELKEKLVNSDEYKDVKQKEQLMEDNCSALLMRYNSLFDEYNQALRFEKYGSDVTKIQKELHECKIELDNNEYVKAYRIAYKSMTNILETIQGVIFQGIIKK